ncbi:MAG TPA: 50S ribosomal protein L11 [Planctomycetota bacterium]|jgi:large subunit ribosomal protein L11|nr:50S ribosomal protein L11 [Planctomycetota bacterium]OQC19601.1 MAG: 50S ribosomal protein L11 [Planctomycetes bacterium ADurb.Bin069]HNR99013.1 50S ribosomal protein L11 [Planctomycetota bacterium]HOE30234.1 50S ribosomal protein L11 [Planctomycetota bacterium]HOE87296.1 50S ribosomal protein L11 [Planctomycetota bacterium]
MGKQLKAKVKLQIPGGQATPAPPVGPALGQHGVNIGEFVQKFNAQTGAAQGTILPVEINVYADRTFDFIVRKPPATVLLKKAASVAKGTGTASREIVGSVNRKALEAIAREKMEDMNAGDVGAAMRILEGTARSMGIAITD